MDTDNNVVKAMERGLGGGGQRGRKWGTSVIVSTTKKLPNYLTMDQRPKYKSSNYKTLRRNPRCKSS